MQWIRKTKSRIMGKVKQYKNCNTSYPLARLQELCALHATCEFAQFANILSNLAWVEFGSGLGQ